MPRQIFLDKTVVEQSIERVNFIFDHYANIFVSISGGKDSTVLAHLVLKEANRRNRKVGVVFFDEEVVYESTIKQIKYLMNLYPDNTIQYWLQMPFNLTNSISLTEGQLIVWEPKKHKLWMRSKENGTIQHPIWDVETQKVADKNKGFGFYDAIENFNNSFENAAFLIGLRATESMNRWRAMIKNPVDVDGKNVYWGTSKGNNCNFYPIFDWNFSDVWKYIGQEKLKYSRIYDLQFLKGFSTKEMRVSSLIHEKSFKSLCELPEFEPKTYDRLVRRVKGISFAQETGKKGKMFRCSSLPEAFKTWKEYRENLIKSYPDKSKIEIFTKRFSRHLENEYVYKQQCRQLILNDYENNLPVTNKEDPRDAILNYYMRNL